MTNAARRPLLRESFDAAQYPFTGKILKRHIFDQLHFVIPAEAFRTSPRGWSHLLANKPWAAPYGVAVQFIGEALKFAGRLGTPSSTGGDTFYVENVIELEDGTRSEHVMPKVRAIVQFMVKNLKNVERNLGTVTTEDLIGDDNFACVMISLICSDENLKLLELFKSLVRENVMRAPESKQAYLTGAPRKFPRRRGPGRPRRDEGRNLGQGAEPDHELGAGGGGDGDGDGGGDGDGDGDGDGSNKQSARRKRFQRKDEAPRPCDLFRVVMTVKQVLVALIDTNTDLSHNADDHRLARDEYAMTAALDVERPENNYRMALSLKNALRLAKTRYGAATSDTDRQVHHKRYRVTDEETGESAFCVAVPELAWAMYPHQMSAERLWGRMFPWAPPPLERRLCRAVSRQLGITEQELVKLTQLGATGDRNRVSEALDMQATIEARRVADEASASIVTVQSAFTDIAAIVRPFRRAVAQHRLLPLREDAVRRATRDIREITLNEMTAMLEPNMRISRAIEAMAQWVETSGVRTMCYANSRWVDNLGTFGNVVTANLRTHSVAGVAEPSCYAQEAILVSAYTAYVAPSARADGYMPRHLCVGSTKGGGKSYLFARLVNHLLIPGTAAMVSGSSDMGSLSAYAVRPKECGILVNDEAPAVMTKSESQLNSTQLRARHMLQTKLTSGWTTYNTTVKLPDGQFAERTRVVESREVFLSGTNSTKQDDAMASRQMHMRVEGSKRPGHGAVHRLIAPFTSVDELTMTEIDERSRKAQFVIAMTMRLVQCGALAHPCTALLDFYLGCVTTWLERHHRYVVSNIRSIEFAKSTAIAHTARRAQHLVFCSEISPFLRPDGSSDDFRYSQLLEMERYLFTTADVALYVISDVLYNATDHPTHTLITWLAHVRGSYGMDLVWPERNDDGTLKDGGGGGGGDADDCDDDDPEINGSYSWTVERLLECVPLDGIDEERHEALGHLLMSDVRRGPGRPRRGRGSSGGGSGGGGAEDEELIDYPLKGMQDRRTEMRDTAQRTTARLLPPGAARSFDWKYKEEALSVSGDRDRTQFWLNLNYLFFPGSIAQCVAPYAQLNSSAKLSTDDAISMLQQLAQRNISARWIPLVQAEESELQAAIERHRLRLWEDERFSVRSVPAFMASNRGCYLLVAALRQDPEAIVREALWSLCDENTRERDIAIAVPRQQSCLVHTFHAKPRPGRHLSHRNLNYVGAASRAAVQLTHVAGYRSAPITDSSATMELDELWLFFDANGLDDAAAYTEEAVERRITEARARAGRRPAPGVWYPSDLVDESMAAEAAYDAANPSPEMVVDQRAGSALAPAPGRHRPNDAPSPMDV